MGRRGGGGAVKLLETERSFRPLGFIFLRDNGEGAPNQTLPTSFPTFSPPKGGGALSQ